MPASPYGSSPPDPSSHEAGASRSQATSQDHVDALSEVERALAGLRHGTVTLVVQDGRVVQVETTSKVRFAGKQRQTTRWNP